VDGVTLITGADGYLGLRIARRLRAEGTPVVATVRALDRAHLATKTAALRAVLGGDLEVVAADVGTADPFAGVDAAPITRIVHAAAVTRFNVPEDLARSTNVEGTARVVELARRCPRLDRLVLLSTVYSSGLASGPADEELTPDDAGFANFYEWSKWESEQVAADAGLPLVIARVSTVIADDPSGAVGQYNAVHNTLRLYFYGLLSLMPGDEDTPVYFVTGDSAADGIVRLLPAAAPLGVFHVCPDRAASATLGDFVELAFAEYERHEHFRRRRVLRPLFCAIEAFDDLVAASRTFRGSPVNQALESVSPFARQLYVHKDVSNDRLRSVWPDYAPPDPRAFITATTAHLVRTRWGRAETAGRQDRRAS
jgi:nucleoside-diphosphate-sugar epimerase